MPWRRRRRRGYADRKVPRGAARPGARLVRWLRQRDLRSRAGLSCVVLVERWRETNEAFVRRDFDAMMSFFASDAVWDLPPAAIGRFEGTAAIRSFHEDWIGSYEEHENELEVQDLGNDVSFVVLSLDARPAGSAGRVQERWGFTVTWAAGMIVRVIGNVSTTTTTAKRPSKPWGWRGKRGVSRGWPNGLAVKCRCPVRGRGRRAPDTSAPTPEQQ